MLTELDSLPSGLLDRPAPRLHEVLSGPTLVHLPGKNRAPLFVSVLLHGNEDTGWDALRNVLSKYRDKTLPRALSFLIGNVAAARFQARHLESQPDFNRVWGAGDTAEHGMARNVVESLQRRNVFASVDIHNNTGLNPHYACINRLEQHFIHLATLFCRTVVYFTSPANVQSRAFSTLCPAVTVECGKSGQIHGVAHAEAFIEALLHLTSFPEQPASPHDYDLFHTVATVRVPSDVRFGFEGGSADLLFQSDLDRLNFQELPKGTTLASVREEGCCRLDVRNEAGDDVSDRYFVVVDRELRTRLPIIPSMLTLSEKAIRQDCLCYLMERLPPISAG